MSVWVKAIEAARMAVKMPIAATTTMTSDTDAEDRVAAGDEVDAGVDHGGGVDEGGDRRGAFHRVRQPDVERELGALADGAAQDQERDRDLPLVGTRPNFANTSCMLSVPSWVQMAMIPSAKPMSPTRLTRNAFLAATAADRRGYQNPISR